jgi:hypothetical protein
MNTHSTLYESLDQGPASASYSSHFAPSPSIYPTSKTENYGIGGYRQQRYNSVIRIPSDTGRSQMPSVTTNFAHRPSNFEQASSMDSGISGISASSSDSKLTNDSGYSSQGFYGSLRDTSNNSYNYTHHRALPPPPPQPPYDRAHAPSYSALDSSNIQENMWQIGNASAGHGHFMAAQQQWASTGTS